MMISYEDLCQALDRFNSRRRNAAEMENLEQSAAADSYSEEPSIQSTPLPEEAPEATTDSGVPIDQDQDDIVPISAIPTDPDAPPEGTKQPVEVTHEIDVDDVEIDEKS